ncbi:MAG: L-fucose:H+ symporter permease [Bacteroidales bacterium]|nr:L-fucose:H+ symporter permease [Bacteroidales bacterium]
MKHEKESSLLRLNGQSMVLPFILVTSLFFFWGVANNLNDTLLAAFKRIMSMSDLQTSFIQMAFYGAYFCFALPAALFIKRFSYKSGVILGLALYATGAMLYYPAGQTGSYGFYLIAIYVLAGGCSILETTSNPYILSMGSKETATRRLNLAQAFNPFGSIVGILISMTFILRELNGADATQRAAMPAAQLAAIQAGELNSITLTYLGIGIVLIAVLCIMLLSRMPKNSDTDHSIHLGSALRRLIRNSIYTGGVVAQFFYVGAQVGIWSFTIRIVMHALGTNETDSAYVFLISMIVFTAARFLFTFLMRYIQASKLLITAAIAAIGCSLCVVFGSGMFLVVFLVMISFFMSLMFPTIYGFALSDLGDDAKIGASGLIMAILGGALITPLQGLASDLFGICFAFLVPLFCFVVVAFYGIRALKAGK